MATGRNATVMSRDGATSTIRIDAGGELSFKEAQAITWTGHMNIEGTLTGTSLRFGTTRESLAATQLQMMRCNGRRVGIDGAGYIIEGLQGTVLIVR